MQFDVIVGINGKNITSAKEIYNIVENLPIGDEMSPLTMDIIRRGRQIRVLIRPEVIEPYR